MNVSPIPGPFHADGNTVYAVDHGKLYTVARANGARLTDSAQCAFAERIAYSLNALDAIHAELDGKEWSSDTASNIANIMRAAVIGEPGEE